MPKLSMKEGMKPMSQRRGLASISALLARRSALATTTPVSLPSLSALCAARQRSWFSKPPADKRSPWQPRWRYLAGSLSLRSHFGHSRSLTV